jgi:hypothetical protein
LKFFVFFGLLILFLWLLRSFVAPGAPGQQTPRRNPGAMQRQEALAVLGLKDPVSSKEVVDAHRKLMQHIHPDKGGSAHLAQQLNEAKRVLLAK